MTFDWRAPVTIKPIGVVETTFQDFSQQARYDSEAVLVLRDDLVEELTGIEHFSHLHVLYYQHRRAEWQTTMGLTQSDETPLARAAAYKGIYTSRSPARPSAIGSCVVELLHRDGNRLRVKGLDAFDGTALLDIKIYVPRYDSFPMADAPLHWCARDSIESTSRLLHWDTMNVGLTLGLRAGQRALRQLDIIRGQADHATVIGGPFFAQGIEAVTGCSVLRNSLDFCEVNHSPAVWSVTLTAGRRRCEIDLADRHYHGADEVLAASDDLLLARVRVQTA